MGLRANTYLSAVKIVYKKIVICCAKEISHLYARTHATLLMILCAADRYIYEMSIDCNYNYIVDRKVYDNHNIVIAIISYFSYFFTIYFHDYFFIIF